MYINANLFKVFEVILKYRDSASLNLEKESQKKHNKILHLVANHLHFTILTLTTKFLFSKNTTVSWSPVKKNVK